MGVGEGKAEFRLDGVYPNPAAPARLAIAFSLPSGERARLELFDAGGRRIVYREVGSLGPGAHRLNLAENHRLAAGVYAVRLTQGGNSRTLKATVSR